MRCLSDIELQAVAAGEAVELAQPHVAGCPRCRARVEEIRRDVRDIAAAVNTGVEVSPRLEARVREAVASREAVRGSTTLRGSLPVSVWRRPRVLLPLATAALLAVMVFGILPRFGSPTTLSASQVLGRSLETLQKAQGIEVLQYELVTTGFANGSWNIVLMVDHERPNRYRVTTMGPNGEVLSAFSQDPVRQRRSQLTRVDGRNYIVTVSSVPNPLLSLPQMAQAAVETMIGMMQATSDQKLTIVDGPTGKEYVVEIPPVAPGPSAATLDLRYARVAVDADDFRITAFEASGALLKQPFTVSFKLLNHLIAGNVSAVTTTPDGRTRPAELFDIEAGPDDVVLEGIASEHPFDELLTTLIRQIARTRTF